MAGLVVPAVYIATELQCCTYGNAQQEAGHGERICGSIWSKPALVRCHGLATSDSSAGAPTIGSRLARLESIEQSHPLLRAGFRRQVARHVTRACAPVAR